jgi:hypothetical protein
MLWKNLPLQTALWKLPVRILLDAIAAWKSLLSGDAGFFIAVLKAHVHFKYWLLFKKHNRIPARTKNNRFSGWYNGSIVWDHFIKRKNSFSEIISGK